MPGFIVVDLDVYDPTLLAEYRAAAMPTLAPYGLEPLARCDQVEVLEGDWAPRRLVVVRVPDVAAGRRWHASTEYQAARAIRLRAAKARMVLLEGL